MRTLVGTCDIWIADLQQAKHQGLAQNIAAFYARSTPLTHQPQPWVFVAGREISWTQACEMFIAPELLRNTAPVPTDMLGQSPLQEDQADLLQSITADLLSCARLEDGMVVFRL